MRALSICSPGLLPTLVNLVVLYTVKKNEQSSVNDGGDRLLAENPVGGDSVVDQVSGCMLD